MRTRLAYAAVLLALLSWVGGITGGMVHSLQVMHVRCVEHGELVEWADGTVRSGDVAQIRATSSHDGHDHGCLLTQTGDQEVLQLSGPTAAAPARLPERLERARVGAPRASPLRDAPKTSPPTS